MRRVKFFALLIMLFVVASAYGADVLRPTGYEAVAIDNNAGGRALTVAKYYNTTTQQIISDYAVIVVETAPIRFKVDTATTVTDTVGIPLQVNQAWVLETYEEIKNFKAIRTGTVSASLKVMYFKRYRQ
jgi:hypothetical protein